MVKGYQLFINNNLNRVYYVSRMLIARLFCHSLVYNNKVNVSLKSIVIAMKWPVTLYKMTLPNLFSLKIYI